MSARQRDKNARIESLLAGSVRQSAYKATSCAVGLYPFHALSTEQSKGPHEQHGNERQIGGENSTTATQVRIQVTGGQALQHANKNGCDDRAALAGITRFACRDDQPSPIRADACAVVSGTGSRSLLRQSAGSSRRHRAPAQAGFPPNSYGIRSRMVLVP